MDIKKKTTGNVLIFGLSLLGVLACPILRAQTQDAKPAAEGTEPAIVQCDSSLMNPVPGESITDAARRLRAWKNCVDAMKSAAEHMVKRVDVENGHLVVGAVPPGLGSIPGLLNVNRLDIYVRNRSPLKHEYTFTARCGAWTQTRSGSVGPSGEDGRGEELGPPSFTLDVSPPCNLMDIALYASSPDEIKTTPERTPASVVPKVLDTDEVQKLAAAVPAIPSAGTYRKTYQLPANQQDARFREIAERCAQTFDVYHGALSVIVTPVPGAVGSDPDSSNGIGDVGQLKVTIRNNSPDAHAVNIRISCGSWRYSERRTIPAYIQYSGANTPFGQRALLYTPGPDCTIDNLQLDTLVRDIE
jgi:hypothetical protein